MSSLALPRQGICDDACAALAEWIAGPSAAALALDANRLSANGGCLLVRAAAECTRPFRLGLSQNRLRGLRIGAVTPAPGGGLRHLELAHADLDAGDIAALAVDVRVCLLLRLVDLTGNTVVESVKGPLYY